MIPSLLILSYVSLPLLLTLYLYLFSILKNIVLYCDNIGIENLISFPENTINQN